jgi:hypothetical protein
MLPQSPAIRQDADVDEATRLTRQRDALEGQRAAL